MHSLLCVHNYVQRVMHLVAFCLCVHLCAWPKNVRFSTHFTGQMVRNAQSSTLCWQRCLLNLLSHTQSAIPLVSIHTVVPQGFSGIYGKSLAYILEIVTPTVRLDTNASPTWWQCFEIAVLNSLYSTVHWQCSAHTEYVHALWNYSFEKKPFWF